MNRLIGHSNASMNSLSCVFAQSIDGCPGAEGEGLQSDMMSEMIVLEGKNFTHMQ